jgi:hypothetical protein
MIPHRYLSRRVANDLIEPIRHLVGDTMLAKRATTAFLATTIGLIGVTRAIGENLCQPALTLSEVQFSPIRTPKLQRNWTAVVTVDTSECSLNSGGHFDIVFMRLSENGPDLEFRQRFAWSPFSQNIALDFAADEAVAQYRIENVTPCVCRDRAAEDRARRLVGSATTLRSKIPSISVGNLPRF